VETERPAEGPARRFHRLAAWASTAAGRPVTFACAVAALLVWAITGPIFDYSDSWQLVINTGTTIVTFLMVFLIQNTQTRDTTAIHIKLDELIRVAAQARNRFMALETLDDDELERLRDELQSLGSRKPVGVPTPEERPTDREPGGRARDPSVADRKRK
jgi:low affinity Fe/Cu permease